jgi:hypothetical protein
MHSQCSPKSSHRQQHHSKESLKRALDRRDRRTLRAIGERLHAIGGCALMLARLMQAAGDDHRLVSLAATTWEGVGGQWYR